MKGKTSSLIIIFITGFIFMLNGDSRQNQNSVQDPKVAYRTIEQSMKEFELQPGYSLEVVVSDPMVVEPVLSVFDGNGRMYVAEMRTYMQDADNTDKFKKISQVVRLEDTNGDGKMDKRTVFAKGLLLPRMILPLDDRIIIGETNTLDLYAYRDTNGDGVADEKKLFFKGGPRGGNLEHQPSGLIWSMDNWIYRTRNSNRLRFTNGELIKEATYNNIGQWGLTQDNTGKVIYLNAGAEKGPIHFQFPLVYYSYQPKWEQSEGYREVFPIDNIPDTQGGRRRLRDDNTLNHFTATCGQEVYRGDRLPKELVGNLFFSEPVGRLIRRTILKKDEHGRIIAHNAYDKSEFIRSRDPNFRVVNMVNAPDGTMYLTDMYRGIIQEGDWTRRGSYLRAVIEKYGLDKNIGKGRIYRLRHKDYKPGPEPKMLDETPAEWVTHLSHPNGWWRDTAQKLIILKRDLSVVPALEKLARDGSQPLGRLHALWTLEGLDALKPDLLTSKYQDSDEIVRAATIRLSEPIFKKSPESLDKIKVLANDLSNDVKKQLILSLNYAGGSRANLLIDFILEKNSQNSFFKEIDQMMRKKYADGKTKEEELAKMSFQKRDLFTHGEKVYKQLCMSCHGINGEGVQSGRHMFAPSFVGNPRVLGEASVLGKIILHGLTGPIDDKRYVGGMMLPMKANDDKFISSVMSYIRNSWGNKASFVSESDVSRIRKETQNRTEPYNFNQVKRMIRQKLSKR